jgi:hypothetical protein
MSPRVRDMNANDHYFFDEIIKRSVRANDMNDVRKDSDDYRDALNALRAEFDRKLAVLRQPGASQRLQEAFDATPAEIAKAANAARKR